MSAVKFIQYALAKGLTEEISFHSLVLEARYFNNPTRNERSECRVGCATDVRGGVSETRYYCEMNSSVHPARRKYITSVTPTLRYTALRLCGVIKMPCLWHDWQNTSQTALIHNNNTFV